MNDAILEITDGTTSITLINKSTGLHLIAWIPNISDYKGGGIFTDPPLADWRQLRAGKFATVEENFTLTASGPSPDNTAFMMQELRRLLQKANDYWNTDWQNVPVWITAKGNCETNTRYTLIVKGRLGNERNYYQQPYTGRKATLQDVPLVIERRAWLSSPPGQGDDIAISASEDYDGRTYGVATATNAAETVVISGGKRIEANLTDVYRFDDTAGTFSSNLLDAALPQALLPSSTTADDIIYFILDTSLSDSGPFDNIVFDIGTAAGSTNYEGMWEYWNGAWTAFPSGDFQDSTAANADEPFSKTGVGTVTFEQKADWATTTINGVTGYIVRMRVTALTGAFTIPTQQNRMIYSAIWPYVEIADNTVPGDIYALSQIRLWPYGQQPGLLGFAYTPRVFVGLRSTDRGANFTPYINTVQEQNPTGITLSAISGSSSFVDDIRSPTGRALQFAPGSITSAIERIRIVFSDALAPEYVGKFRCFLRIRQVSGSATYTFRLLVSNASGTIVYRSDFVDSAGNPPALSSFLYTYVDFGEVDFGAFSGVIKNADESGGFRVSIQIGSDATGSVNVIDLVAMPIDEWSGVFKSEPVSSTFLGIQSFLFDSVEFPKKPVRALVHDSNEIVVGNVQSRINGPVMLQANKSQRYWFFVSEATTESIPGAATTYVMAAQVNRVAQYFAQRGGR